MQSRLGKHDRNQAYYTQQYVLLIAKARAEHRGTKSKPTHGYSYCEEHHIVPICCGGSDKPGNLVLLTAREHFVAHRLLQAMFPESVCLLAAVAAFQMNKADRKLNSRQVEIARQASAQRMRSLACFNLHPAQLAVATNSHHWQSEQHSCLTSQRNFDWYAAGKHPMQQSYNRLAKSECMKLLHEQGLNPLQTEAAKAKQKAATSKSNARLIASGEFVLQRQHCCVFCRASGKGPTFLRWHGVNCLANPLNAALSRQQIKLNLEQDVKN